MGKDSSAQVILFIVRLGTKGQDGLGFQVVDEARPFVRVHHDLLQAIQCLQRDDEEGQSGGNLFYRESIVQIAGLEI